MLDIKGSINVTKNNFWSNNIQYQVLFLKDRLVLIKTGGQFANQGGTGSYLAETIGGVIGVVILARVGGGLYGILGAGIGGAIGALIGIGIGSIFAKRNKKKIANKLNDLSNASIEEIIQSDKKNCEIPYGEITNIKISKSKFGVYGVRKGVLIVEGIKNLKLDIIDKQNIEDIEILVSSIVT